jgi:putative N-acetyltransferase (TIGR04045 family)
LTITEPILTLMGGPRPRRDTVLVEPADAAGTRAYRALRHAVFVHAQGVFAHSDHDDRDDDPETVVLVARSSSDGHVLGGVRIHPHSQVGGSGAWWRGSRLVVDPRASVLRAGVGSRLVRAAMALAENCGALRFDATVQLDKRGFFERLGWRSLGPVQVAGWPHELMLAPGNRFERILAEYKTPLGRLLEGMVPGGPAHVGDDAAPVPGSRILAACDAILPSMVERDPEWAGWCGVLVNVNDLAAKGAEPVGLLDSVAGRDEQHVARVLRGLRAAADAWGVPILGGHTQLGGHGALTVTALGDTDQPVPAGGGRPGDVLRLVADLAGRWRPGYGGAQWDSTTFRSPDELRRLTGTLARHRPAAAKDVSMAGLVGTIAMLAEASGTGAELDVSAIPSPPDTRMADWLTCFPGYAMVTADRPGTPEPDDVAPATVGTIGTLTEQPGIRLRWPDGRTTTAVAGPATGLGRACLPAGAPAGDREAGV